jgi:hypothetical protein
MESQYINTSDRRKRRLRYRRRTAWIRRRRINRYIWR